MQRNPADGRSVAIIGAGNEGAQLAWLSFRAGFRTIVEDVFPSRLRGIESRMRGALDADSGSAAPLEMDPGRLEFANTIEDALREADFVLDSVPDELESKLEIFSLVDRMAPPRTVLCSPLRSVSIGDLASCTYRADRCIGLRIEQAMPDWTAVSSVTLMRGPETSDETVREVSRLWERMGKQVRLMTE
jgi:3-hydroxybutyryl-CoA dehydrogenase